MSLNLALNNALSGLRLNQEAMTVLSQNLANANTPGYSRQIINQSAVTVAGQGSGVQIDSITRKVDNYLLRTVQSQGSTVQQSSVINNYQGQLQTLLGSPGASNSLDEYLTDFTNALQQFSDTPDSSANRNLVVSSAGTLATQVSNLAGSIEDLRFQSDQDIQSAVNTMNQQISQLNDLNKAIASAAVTGQSTAGLLDQRDLALNTLSQQINISTSFDVNGVVSVTAGNGVALVDSGITHQVSFTPAESVDAFIQGQSLSALTVNTLDSSGKPIGTPSTLISGGASDQVTSTVTSGAIGGLEQLRDNLLPQVLDELDSLASNLRDSVNAIQNSGTAFPPPNSLTGTRAVIASDVSNWSGAVRIAVLNADGTPIPSGYADDTNGLAPLTLDLNSLNTGSGEGKPSVQGIIDEINQYFDAPQPKVELGNLNNIQLTSDTNALPSGSPSLLNFDFDLQNLSSSNAQFFVTGVTVKDDTGGDISNVTQSMPTIQLSSTNTYETTATSNVVTINLATAPSGLKAGDWIYLSAPSVPDINNIPPGDLTGYIQVQSVNGKQITVNAADAANADGPVSDAAPGTLQPPVNAAAGLDTRTGDSGELQVNLSGAPASTFYDITATVAVAQADGTVKNSQITYRVSNNQTSLLNQRYSATDATADGNRVLPDTSQGALKAILVDANGQELAKDANGNYIDEPGYLEIVGNNGNSVAIDSLNSEQLGNLDDSPPTPGTDRGFSYYFELNNFFDSNQPSLTGDTVANSAINLKVADRIAGDPNLVSSGQLSQSNQPTDPSQPPNYTYQVVSGDNTTAAQFTNLANQQITFAAAGGLPRTTITLGDYTSEFLASISSNATAATSTYTNANTLLQGFQSQATAVSGVSIDDELANTVTYQNAYSATARIVTVINQMYQDIINMLG